jgi:hypothetical protein
VKRLAAFAVLLAAACGSNATPDECKGAVDRMLDILAAPKSADKESASASEAWKKALKNKDPSRQVLLDMCTRQMKAAHVECVLAAKDEQDLAKCFGG